MPLVGSSVDAILTVETSPGSGIYTDLTAYLLHGSLTIKLNTVDFALLDPPAGSVVLTDGVKIRNPTWSGTIAAITTSDLVDLRVSHVVYGVTVTNAVALPTDTAPFDLSDVPSVTPPFDYLLEDGSGHYMLEDSTDWAPGAYMLEGTYAKGYSHLSVQTNTVAGSPNKTLGRCQVVAPGLRPGNLFKLTSLNQGYAAASFQVTQVTSRWPALSNAPFFDIEFGDSPQTLAAWTLAHASTTAVIVSPPTLFPTGQRIFGQCTSATGVQTIGGGIVTVATATFTVQPDAGHTLTCQVQAAIDARMEAWDNYVATPRRAVRATLSGGLFTGTWQELPFGLTEVQLDLSSASGIAMAAGTYTVTIDIDTQEYNQMRIYNGWAQVAVIQT